MSEEQKLNTGLSIWCNSYTDLVARDYEQNGLEMDDYSKTCCLSAMSSIYSMVTTSGVEMSAISSNGLREIVGQCASLKLNANTVPKEVFFNLRKKKVGNEWIQTVELGLTTNAYLSMLRNFGVNVKTVHDAWFVKQGDEFTYPKRKGLTTIDPEWNPMGLSPKTVRVVVPVEHNDGSVTYLISERDSVKNNILAHIKQNLLNETFGICADRYKATDEQKKKIAEKKAEILNHIKTLETIDDILADDVARSYLSPAWQDNADAMIDTKLVGNAIRKCAKDFNAMATKSFMQMDETYQNAQEEIEENANSEIFVDATVVESVE